MPTATAAPIGRVDYDVRIDVVNRFGVEVERVVRVTVPAGASDDDIEAAALAAAAPADEPIGMLDAVRLTG